MEFVARTNHKYIMHGFLWSWHKDHHVNDHKRIKKKQKTSGFEKNDLFFLVYALPAIVLMMYGINQLEYWAISVASGITLYGFTYFLFHDSIIHKRVKLPNWTTKNNYFKALLKAHEAHHHGRNKKDFNNYGLFIFQTRFLKS